MRKLGNAKTELKKALLIQKCRYSVINFLRLFWKGQMSKDKSTFLLAIKNLIF